LKQVGEVVSARRGSARREIGEERVFVI